MAEFWEDKTVMVTGGGGSIASEVIVSLLEKPVHAVRAFDASEDALFRLTHRVERNPRLRTLLGDIRDRERVKMAIDGVDMIIHTAAVKNIEVSEANVPETLRVNVEGTVNLVECCMREKPDRFIFVSSDKAADYTSLYGVSKYAGEKTVLWASRVAMKTIYGCVRLGNVMETRGNVFDTWSEEQSKGKPLSITHPDMKRFFMHVGEASAFIIKSLEVMENGCIYVPKMKEYSVMGLANTISPRVNVIGVRPGEKMREVLIASGEKPEDRGDYWLIRG